MEWITANWQVALAPFLISVCSLVSALIKDKTGIVMKIVNMIALNVGKASNDPAENA
jgi:hypothetical protein